MNFFSNIGFGNFSSTNTEVNAVPNPYFSTYDANIYQSYVSLAFNTNGAVFDMRYFYKFNTPYSPTLIANLFKFAVIDNAPCDINGKLITHYSISILKLIYQHLFNIKSRFRKAAFLKLKITLLVSA